MMLRRYKRATAGNSCRSNSLVDSMEDKPKLEAPAATEIPVTEPPVGVTPEPFHEEMEIAKQFTRTEVNRMPVAELKEVATSLGLPVSEESTGAKLKSAILEKLKL